MLSRPCSPMGARGRLRTMGRGQINLTQESVVVSVRRLKAIPAQRNNPTVATAAMGTATCPAFFQRQRHCPAARHEARLWSNLVVTNVRIETKGGACRLRCITRNKKGSLPIHPHTYFSACRVPTGFYVVWKNLKLSVLGSAFHYAPRKWQRHPRPLDPGEQLAPVTTLPRRKNPSTR